jgi:hypothetical protein
MVRFIPGIGGAVCGFIALKLIKVLALGLGLEIVIFLAAYLTAAIALDRAIARHPQTR